MTTNYNLHVQVCVLPLFTHNPSSLGLPSVWLPTNTVTAFQASGGSTLLNLDFFGPVDDSSSSSSTLPGQQSFSTVVVISKSMGTLDFPINKEQLDPSPRLFLLMSNCKRQLR